jgi:hypothetical protein
MTAPVGAQADASDLMSAILPLWASSTAASIAVVVAAGHRSELRVALVCGHRSETLMRLEGCARIPSRAFGRWTQAP